MYNAAESFKVLLFSCFHQNDDTKYLAMLEGRSSNVLLLQFTARLCTQKMRNGEKDFPQVSRKTNFCTAP
jgi:hypothetical protein